MPTNPPEDLRSMVRRELDFRMETVLPEETEATWLARLVDSLWAEHEIGEDLALDLVEAEAERRPEVRQFLSNFDVVKQAAP